MEIINSHVICEPLQIFGLTDFKKVYKLFRMWADSHMNFIPSSRETEAGIKQLTKRNSLIRPSTNNSQYLTSGIPRNLSWGCTPKSLGSEYKLETFRTSGFSYRRTGYHEAAIGTFQSSHKLDLTALDFEELSTLLLL